MRRLKRISHIAITCAVGIVITSCTHMPKAVEETEGVLNIRNEYLRTHPDGRFNDVIANGQVCKGMNFIEVLAAWGLPEKRFRSPENDVEYWAYFSMDEVSLDWVRYVFAFEKNAVVGWETSRHNGKFGRFDAYEQRVTREELLRNRPGMVTDLSSVKK